MLNVLTKSGAYLRLDTGNGYIPSFLIGPAADIISGGGPLRPAVDLGFFDQGPIGDDAGNTSVYHEKVDGNVFALPVGVEEQQFVQLLSSGIVDAYSGNFLGSRTTFTTIFPSTGGSWKHQTRYEDLLNSYPNFCKKNYKYNCSDSVEIRRPRAGVLEWTYNISASWLPSENSPANHLVTFQMVQTATFYVTYSSGRYYTRAVSLRKEKKHWGRTDKTVEREYKNDIKYSRVFYLDLPDISNFGLAFNSRTWSATMRDIAYQEKVDQIWPSLCQDAILSMNYTDCNMLALIHDIANLKSTVEDSADALRNLKDIPGSSTKDALKMLSNADLSRRYGYGLTIQDSLEVGKALERLRQNLKTTLKHCQKIRSATTTSVSSSTGLTVDLDYHYLGRLSLNSPAISKVIQSLYEWDLYPSLGNAWDFVPYSFVVDWFVDVGGMLEDADANLQMRQYHLLSAIKSQKVYYSGTPTKIILSDFPLGGNVDVTVYRRWIDKQFDPMPLSLTCDPTKWIGHLVEGAELLIQRL